MSPAHSSSRHPDTRQNRRSDVNPTKTEVIVMPKAYEGDDPAAVNVAYRFVLRRRRAIPTVRRVMEMTRTNLSSEVVASLMAAAERLNSLTESPHDAMIRAEMQRRKSEIAQSHEDAFIEQLVHKGFSFTREKEQREDSSSLGLIRQGTPDVRFTNPVAVHGEVCGWIEFKDYFGFPNNPFIAQKEKRQLKKYVVTFGAGIVVYSCGFQQGYPKIDGVRVCRAAEFLECLIPAK